MGSNLLYIMRCMNQHCMVGLRIKARGCCVFCRVRQHSLKQVRFGPIVTVLMSLSTFSAGPSASAVPPSASVSSLHVIDNDSGAFVALTVGDLFSAVITQ